MRAVRFLGGPRWLCFSVNSVRNLAFVPCAPVRGLSPDCPGVTGPVAWGGAPWPYISTPLSQSGPMNSIFKGDVSTARGRALAWVDSLLIDHAVFRLVWSNFAAVAPGRLYRCNHPTPARLAALTRRYGLKTLINLRGETGNGSDALSRDGRPRAWPGVRRLRRWRAAARRSAIGSCGCSSIFRQMRAPALLHCKSGADRAGLAAGLFVLFQGGTAREALAAAVAALRPHPPGAHRRAGRVLPSLRARGRGTEALPRLGARGLR